MNTSMMVPRRTGREAERGGPPRAGGGEGVDEPARPPTIVVGEGGEGAVEGGHGEEGDHHRKVGHGGADAGREIVPEHFLIKTFLIT